MASVWRDKRSGKWVIKFLYMQQAFTRSLRTKSETKASRLKTLVEETVQLLQTGRLEIPTDVEDEGTWILTGGKLTAKPINPALKVESLGDVCDKYLLDQVDKHEATQRCEVIHIAHLKRILGTKSRLRSLSLDDMQKYINTRRSEDNRRGGKISGVTIKKELTTFAQVWDWARSRNRLTGVKSNCPIRDPIKPRKWAVRIPKADRSARFMTWSEIERRVERGGITTMAESELWRMLYLDDSQLTDLLNHVNESATHSFVYPMFAFAAYTGARRSEICRSLIDDFDFEAGIVTIRESKRKKDLAATARHVPLSDKLRVIMEEWFSKHPGGQYTITLPLVMPKKKMRQELSQTNRNEATYHFKQTVADSKWSKVSGFHVLRHSFGAICTRAGIPINVIAAWMGHATEEMKEHYQHLLPQDQQDWMKKLPL